MTGPLARRRGARLGLGFAMLAGLIAIAALAVAGRREASAPARADGGKPVLMLLTSLPLVFGEGFSLESGGSPALAALEQRYKVVPISVADRSNLAQGRILLMAHPLAQPAEALVDLDAWVRQGGKVLLLADSALDWPSARPLGDALRPPPMFADTGLLKHWGLALTAPDERGPVQRTLAGRAIMGVSPGSLSGSCEISRDRFVARCRIGRGTAVVVADADFLNVEDLDGPIDDNLPALVAELATLDR